MAPPSPQTLGPQCYLHQPAKLEKEDGKGTSALRLWSGSDIYHFCSFSIDDKQSHGYFRCKGCWKIQSWLGSPFSRNNCLPWQGKQILEHNWSSLPQTLNFFHKTFAFGELLIHSYSFYPYFSIIMTPKSPFLVPTFHRCLVSYLQPPSKHQLSSLKFNIFPRPELALVLAFPSSDSGPLFSWHHL